MSTEQNKSIVRRWIEEGWNKHNLGVIDEVYAPNFVQHESEPQTVNSSEALKAYVGNYVAAFPDLYLSIEDLIAEGDKVVWRFNSTGHQDGPFLGMPRQVRAAILPALSSSASRTAASPKPGSTSMCWGCCNRPA